MKVLIYSNPELFKNSSFEGRAEADLVAYNTSSTVFDSYISYRIVKDNLDILFKTDRLVSLREIKSAVRSYERTNQCLVGI